MAEPITQQELDGDYRDLIARGLITDPVNDYIKKLVAFEVEQGLDRMMEVVVGHCKELIEGQEHE